MTDHPDRPQTNATAHALLRSAKPRRRVRSRMSRAVRALAVVAVLLVLSPLVLAGAVMGGLGGERLRVEAQSALTELVGGDIVTTIGSVRLRIDSDRFLALEISGAGLSGDQASEAFADVGLLRFGIRFLPLLEGRIQLANARLSDARLVADQLPDRGGPGPLAGLRNAEGLLDPDLVTPSVFQTIHRAFDLVETNAARDLKLDNVVIVLDSQRGTSLRIVEAQLARTVDGSLEMEGIAEIADRTLMFDGRAQRDSEGTRITMLDLDMSFAPVEEGVERIGLAHRVGGLSVSLSGAQSLSSAADRLDIEASFERASVDIGRETVTLSGALRAYAATGANKIEIENLELRSEGTQWAFNGAVGPEPRRDGIEPRYRFELVSDQSRLSVPGSDEDLTIRARLGGTFDPIASVLDLADLGVRTQTGTATGRARLDFVPGMTPGVRLALDARDIEIDHAKALWPVFAAAGARRWAVERVDGGKVTQGEIFLATEPGQFGNGIPFTDEITGRFAIEGASLDVGGELPLIQDATGELRFRGDNLDASVQTARAQLASGKWVSGKNAIFAMDLPRNAPLIGNLDVEIDADADAALEFASLEPIDAGKHLDFAPSGISGHVAGRVRAQFPVNARGQKLPVGFDVELDIADISLAEPLQGQTVEEAYGTVRIAPSHAEIKADAKLNGIPASIEMTEPFVDTVDRSRKVDLQLDDAARDQLLPALSMLLSGSADVGIDLSSGERQSVTADLSGSVLSLPWIGWSKGAGIAATTAFQMERNGGQTFLHGFGIQGESFAVGGEVSLDEAGLTKASFPRVRLNRGDDFSLDIQRRGRGYSITVKGQALDARSLIRALRATSEAAGGTAGNSVPIQLDVNVGAITGFGNETLRDVVIAYSGTGSTIENLTASALTGSGARLEVSLGIGQAGRFLRADTGDAGAVLRFLDLYSRMEGGSMRVDLRGAEGGALVGRVAARDFWLVDEPRLASLVSSPSDDRGRSLNDVVRGQLNVQRVFFDRAVSGIKQGRGYLVLENGVIRGPNIGSTFQGTVYDEAGNMSMTGTFMPAYGINRLFAEIPLIGQILGNGRDRGLIGITFKLAGSLEAPQLQINPLSAIAPGIFRSVFEFAE
ncbi:hypothetical protein GTW25_19595 [Aliihoeflea aestuarii]|uniref:DUF3971 domain-containing protein n=1 Tax=Aliihoeflea aestuarii TaxID=453840 RepID=UPI0020965BD6|nr:DUF3971 domain-containing protein [Aliihoeflea aestuarii]MCO6393227.1 hypothetical protein [Aliihoeflea aestuarii]